MKKYDLTEQGASDKLAELYALSNSALAIQAAAIAVDFKGWMKNNFNLTTEQEDYIDGMNTTASLHFGSQCSTCFLFRLNINLDYPAPPVTPGYGKWVELQSSMVIATDGNGAVTADGELTFAVSYVH